MSRQAQASQRRARPVGPLSGSAQGAGTRTPKTRRELLVGGTAGNERLTVLTGLLLIPITAAVGVTIIWIGQLIWLHLYLGLVLIGPVVLKLASTGYRFVRYYSRNPAYRRKGPPIPVLRGLAPLVVLSTMVLFATGVALLFAGHNTGLPLVLLHKVSFFVWIAFVGLHVLGHLPEILRLFSGASRSRRQIMSLQAAPVDGRRTAPPNVERVAGARGRGAALLVSLLGGLVLATALIGQFSVWTH